MTVRTGARPPRRGTLSLAILLVVIGGAPAWADPPSVASIVLRSPADAGESAVVQELEVIGRRPGPALWRVRRGTAEVTILGALTPLPHALAWDQRRLQAAMEGARLVLLPPKSRTSLVGAMQFALFSGRLKLGDGRTLEAALPPALAQRFAAARTRAGRDAKAYASWKPAAAGVMLLADTRKRLGLSDAKPGSTVQKLAAARHVPTRAVGDLRLRSLFDSLAALSPAQNLACLTAALDQADAEAAHAGALASAWSNGDLEAVRAPYAAQPVERCLAELKSFPAIMAQGTDDQVRAVQAALAGGGRTVAVIDLNFLLRPDGVLDRLRASGAEITVPPE